MQKKIWALAHLYARARYGYIWAKNSSYIPLLTPKKCQKADQVVQKKGQKKLWTICQKAKKTSGQNMKNAKNRLKKSFSFSGKLV